MAYIIGAFSIFPHTGTRGAHNGWKFNPNLRAAKENIY